MPQKYSQFRALMALAKASFKAMLRSPSAVVFTVGFPLIFVLVFGFIGDSAFSVRIGVAATSDVNNPIYQALARSKVVRLVTGETRQEMLEDLKKGRLTSIINITADSATSEAAGKYRVQLYTSSASADKIGMFRSVLRDIINSVNEKVFPKNPSVAAVHTILVPGRIYRQIDFILPGMLGFSLLSTGVFGTAFLFFSLRQTLVLKRFFATPVRRFNILLGEALARLVFQLLGAIFLIVIGYYFFRFTLIHGFETVFEMLVLSAFGLIIFMGFGFIISGISRNESSIPPIANIVTLPQFLLAGTFFPIDVFPSWLQPICKIMPLTYLNDALRKIAFEGARLWQLPKELLILVVWGLVVYAVAIKVFRWE
jgi:ABC-2 type transport system permease protein